MCDLQSYKQVNQTHFCTPLSHWSGKVRFFAKNDKLLIKKGIIALKKELLISCRSVMTFSDKIKL